MSSLPAILGGEPLFAEWTPMVRPWLPSFSELAPEIEGVISSGMLTKGKHLAALEAAAAEALEVEHVIAMANCTMGLLLAFLCLELTGEIIMPSFTFMATGAAAVRAGLKPVFVDVDPGAANLDPAAVEAAITPRTSAVVAVHNFGAPAAVDELCEIARRRGLKLIFDAAHGLGSLYRGRPLGGQGDAQVFSLTPTKLVVGGEGGLAATNNGRLAEKLRAAREYGASAGYNSVMAGLNGRLGEFNALLALASLKMLPRAAANRNQYAALMRERLGGLPGVSLQEIDQADTSSYKDFCLFIDPERFGVDRNRLALALRLENLDSRPYYDPPLHRQDAYRRFYNGAQLPVTERLSESCLCLPMWSRMEPELVSGVCRAVERIHKHGERIGALNEDEIDLRG